MAVAAAINSTWQVAIRGRQDGQRTINVFDFVCVGASSDVELHLILVLINCFITNLLPVLSSSWTLEDVVWRQTGPTLGLENVTVPEGAGPGGGAAQALPSMVAAVISKHTLLAGRSGRGRTFIPGIPEAATTNSNLDTGHAFWAGLLAFAACVIGAFVHVDPAGGTDLFDLAVYSRKIGGSAFPFGGSGFHAVRSYVPTALLATMRSRKVGRGE